MLAAPVRAENTNVNAQPQASIAGSVANQAVQINQGSLSTQMYSKGHACNGPVMTVTPYFLQTETVTSTSSQNRNFGGQVSVSFPLDRQAVRMCKDLAARNLEKQRLDYELVRIKECISIYEKGFRIHPDSSFYPLCADVIPIASSGAP